MIILFRVIDPIVGITTNGRVNVKARGFIYNLIFSLYNLVHNTCWPHNIRNIWLVVQPIHSNTIKLAQPSNEGQKSLCGQDKLIRPLRDEVNDVDDEGALNCIDELSDLVTMS